MKRTTGANIARGTGLALVLALAWFSTQALIPFSLSDQEPKGQRIAALDDNKEAAWFGNDDGMRDVAWLGNGQIVEYKSTNKLEYVPADRKRIDLSSQTATPLAPLPPMPSSEEHAARRSVYYGRRPDPIPSPDGQWLLYDEYRSINIESKESYAIRYRLTRPDGSQPRFVPANGQFQPSVNREGFPHWLPNGSGWVWHGIKTRSADLYSLATPDAAPKHIPLPEEMGPLRGITQDGYLIFVESAFNDGTLVSFVPLHSGQAVRQPIELTKSLPPGRFEGSDSYTYSFSSADAMVVRLRCDDSRLMAWVHRLLHKPTGHREYWQVFYDGRRPRRLFSTTEYIYYFSLSPNGKRLIYWQDDKAYLYTMP